MTVAVIPFLFIIRNEPTHPPSLVSTQKPIERKFFKAIKDLLKIRSYVLLIIIFGLIDGSFISFSDIISQIFS